MLSFKNLENFTIMKSEKRTQVNPNKKAMTSQNFQKLTIVLIVLKCVIFKL